MCHFIFSGYLLPFDLTIVSFNFVIVNGSCEFNTDTLHTASRNSYRRSSTVLDWFMEQMCWVVFLGKQRICMSKRTNEMNKSNVNESNVFNAYFILAHINATLALF